MASLSIQAFIAKNSFKFFYHLESSNPLSGLWIILKDIESLSEPLISIYIVPREHNDISSMSLRRCLNLDKCFGCELMHIDMRLVLFELVYEAEIGCWALDGVETLWGIACDTNHGMLLIGRISPPGLSPITVARRGVGMETTYSKEGGGSP